LESQLCGLEGAQPPKAKVKLLAETSPATTARDLADLTENGALVRTGERKHARYAMNLARG